MVNFPTREMGSAHLPILALGVCSQDERTLASAYENSYSAHDAFDSVFELAGQSHGVLSQAAGLPARLSPHCVSPSYDERTRHLKTSKTPAPVNVPARPPTPSRSSKRSR